MADLKSPVTTAHLLKRDGVPVMFLAPISVSLSVVCSWLRVAARFHPHKGPHTQTVGSGGGGGGGGGGRGGGDGVTWSHFKKARWINTAM